MKKIWILGLSAVMALSLAACSGTTDPASSQSESVASSSRDSQAKNTSSLESAEPGSESEKEAAAPSSEPVTEGEAQQADSQEASEEPVPVSEGEAEGESGNILVAYFSYAENAALPEDIDASASASIQLWNDRLTGNTGVVADMIAEATGAERFSIRTVEKYPDSYDATLDRAQEEQSTDARPELAELPENLDSYDVVFLGFPNWWGDMPMALYRFLEEVDLSGKTIIPFVTSGGSGFSGTRGTIEEMEPDAAVEEGLALRDSDAAEAREQIIQWLSDLGYAQ